MPTISPKEKSTPTNPLQTLAATTKDPRQIDTSVAAQGSAPQPEATGTPEEAISPKFAALAREQKRAREIAEKVKLERAAFEAEKKAWEEQKNGFIPKDKLKESVFAAMKSGELPYDEIAQHLIDQPASQVDPVIQTMQSKIDALEARLVATDTQFKEKQTQEYQSAVAQIKNDAQSLIDSDPYFETLKTYGMVDDVVTLIENKFKEEGVLLSVEDAAKQLEDETFSQAEKIRNLSKFKKLLEPAPATPEPQKQPTKEQPLKTLSRDTTSSTNGLSRYQRAILAAQGKLN